MACAENDKERALEFRGKVVLNAIGRKLCELDSSIEFGDENRDYTVKFCRIGGKPFIIGWIRDDNTKDGKFATVKIEPDDSSKGKTGTVYFGKKNYLTNSTIWNFKAEDAEEVARLIQVWVRGSDEECAEITDRFGQLPD